jgi:hypothetical protein
LTFDTTGLDLHKGQGYKISCIAISSFGEVRMQYETLKQKNKSGKKQHFKL